MRKLFDLLIGGVLLAGVSAAAPANAISANSRVESAEATLPSPGVYTIDPDHTFAYFAAWHHVVGRVRGRFDKVSGTITVSRDSADCTVDISIDTVGINTQNAERDEDLRGPEFFDVKKYPVMSYRGRGIHPASMGKGSKMGWVMEGTLTIRGVSRVVPLTFTFPGLVVTYPGSSSGSSNNPPGTPRRPAFHASAGIRRGDFGMVRDNLMELGMPPAPGADVEIEIDVEADEVVKAP